MSKLSHWVTFSLGFGASLSALAGGAVRPGPVPSPLPTSYPSPYPTSFPTPTPTATPTPRPTPVPTATPTPRPTPRPTPTITPSPSPTPRPTSTPPVGCSEPPAPRDCLRYTDSVCQNDLLSELEGFGRETTGGQGGEMYKVTSLADDGAKGTLRYGVQSSGKKWIIFGVSGTITLKSKLVFKSDKTVDGRGAQITIKNNTIDIPKTAQNVILNDIKVTESAPGGQDTEGMDNIGINDGAKRVWIHHVESSKSGDGLIDMKRGATDITISWTRLTDKPNKAMLITATEDLKPGKVTLHHNHWLKGDDRQPKVDGYQVHIYNDFYDYSENGVDITCYNKCQIFVENSIWAPKVGNQNKLGVTTSGDREGYSRASGNLLKSGIWLEQHKPENVFTPPYLYTPDVAADDLACQVRNYAGPRWKK